MKNYLSLIVCLFFLSNSYAKVISLPTAEDKCRPTLVNAICSLSQKEKIQADLLSGIWMHELVEGEVKLGLKERYEFEELGQLKRTAIFDNGHSETTNHLWRIEEVEDNAFLVIYDSEIREELYYKVTQNCEGILLTDIINYEMTFLSFHREANYSELENTRLRIAGHWQCQGELFNTKEGHIKIKDAFLNYEFDLNGQFTRIMGNTDVQVEEQGFWEVSSDGSFLLLKFSKTASTSDIYTTQYIQLKNVGISKLEIEQSLTTVGAYARLFCSDQKEFVLNKTLSSF